MPSNSRSGQPPDEMDLSGPGLRVFVKIAREWGLSEIEQTALLGGRDPLAHTLLSPDELLRVSLIIGIYKEINILLPIRERANGWIRAKNGAFDGSSALEVMMAEDLFGMTKVRRYLAAEAN